MRFAFLRPYSSILSVRGAWRFSLAAWFARLARSTAPIGTILLVASRVDNYTLAGLASGAVVLGAAVTAPLWSRAADRLGQSRVLPVALAASALSATALILAVDLRLPTWTLLVSSVLVGASSIDAGSLSRARWLHLLDKPDQRHAALALESVGDEFTFVVGPPIVTVVAAAISPELGFLTGVGASLIGGLALLAQRSTAPKPTPARGNSLGSWLPPGVLGLLPGYVGVGLIFGSVDLSAVGIATERNEPWLAGVLLSVFAVGSVTAGIVFGAIAHRWTPLTRLAIGVVWFAVVMPWFAVVSDPLGFAIASLAGGLALTPVLIASSSVIETFTARGAITVAMSWPTVALSIGVTIGSALSGTAIDAGESYAGLWVPVLASAIVLVSGITNVLVRRRRSPVRESGVVSN
jgi:predicted MFS family arabinose efflux permease